MQKLDLNVILIFGVFDGSYHRLIFMRVSICICCHDVSLGENIVNRRMKFLFL